MKITKFVLLSLLFFLSVNTINVRAEEPIEKPVAIFYSPHQDDELLSMGHAISLYVQNGYEVHVVLLTDGSATSAIHSVNKEVVKHYLKPISTKEFSDARNLEFIRSLSALGVERDHIHFTRLKDGKTTVNQVEETVLKYKTRYPEAQHMALSYHDNHNDHRNSGLALNHLYKNGILTEPKFYIQNNERNIVDGVYEPYTFLNDQPITNATIPYTAWDPLRRMYSIGIISVPYDFKLLERDPRSKYHLIDQ
ncbi:PIG-L deacetylase family protein [Rossellomorea arthrocnemi]